MSTFLRKSEDANPNYLATICQIENLYPIEGADRLMRTTINGNDMVVSKDMKIGDVVVYFPVETAICEQFLSANNLYELSEAHRNANFEHVESIIKAAETTCDDVEIKHSMELAKSMCGFFNKRGRVRMLKLRGQYSMGFVIPVESLRIAFPDLTAVYGEIGTQFNYVGDTQFCWKYVPITDAKPQREHDKSGKWKKLMRRTRERFDKLIEGQFEFHYDTKKLEGEIGNIHPDHTVSVSVKVHGTSVILSNILCNRKLTFWEKVKKFFGCNVPTTEYSNIYSSRKVIKNRYLNEGVRDYYGSDIWGCVNKAFEKFLSPGMTVYGEIVGYIEGTTQMIQAKHDYGCEPGQWKFMPYRITLTAADGSKTELNVEEVQSWINCILDTCGNEKAYQPGAKWYTYKDCLMPLNILYHGPLKDMYDDLDVENHFHENLLERMKNDKAWLLMEKNEPMCKNKVPREGVVIRIDDDICPRAWKLKSKAHYNLEALAHDNDEVDIEEIS